MKKSFLLLCAATVTISFARADDAVPTAAQITERWRSYFQALQNVPSWTYNAQMQLWEKDLKKPEASAKLSSDIKIKFAKDKNLFRREMQVREDEKADFQKVLMAFGGQKYQMMVHNPKPEDINGHKMHDLMTQSLKPIPGDPTDTINTHFAVTMPFLFLTKNSAEPLSTLANAATWADVQKHILKVQPTTWENRTGYLLTFSPNEDDVDMARGEVFMDSASGLPLHVVSFNKTTGAAAGELKITQLKEATETTPAFPLLIELNGPGTPEKAAGNGTIAIDPASLNFAPTFAPEFFKVPASAVEIITEGDKIVYSRYPMPKEPAAKAKTPAKTKTPVKAKPKQKR